MTYVLNEDEMRVCRILHFAMTKKHGLCDPTNFSDTEEQILLDFQEKGYLKNDINCIVITEDFKNFLYDTFGKE